MAEVQQDMQFHQLVQQALRAIDQQEAQMHGSVPARMTGEVSPVKALVDAVLSEAADEGASDIHVEPQASSVRIRVRIDGLLQRRHELPKRVYAVFLSCIKVLAKMDVSKTREPQDGRFTFAHRGDTGDIDVRAATMPSIHGEAIVLRLLPRDGRVWQLGALGFSEKDEARIRALLAHPSGITAWVGPMGAGKTTTLYAGLSELNREETSIVTLDDPVEYLLPDVLQIPVREEAGMTFAETFRHVLRLDAEIFAVGEMRDEATAEVALRAALTGHRVLTTLHADDACLAVLRLLEMHLPPYLLAATLRGVIAQRLVRRICPDCREAYAADAGVSEALGIPVGTTLYRGRGCPACHGTGYRGRMVLAEVLVLTERMRAEIVRGVEIEELRKLAKEAGLRTMREDGHAKVLAGETTWEEVRRMLGGT